MIIVAIDRLNQLRMQDFQTLETSQLVDLLAKHTSDYTRMMTENTKNEAYEKCMLAIKAIQAEIDFRKSNITSPPDFS